VGVLRSESRDREFEVLPPFDFGPVLLLKNGVDFAELNWLFKLFDKGGKTLFLVLTNRVPWECPGILIIKGGYLGTTSGVNPFIIAASYFLFSFWHYFSKSVKNASISLTISILPETIISFILFDISPPNFLNSLWIINQLN